MDIKTIDMSHADGQAVTEFDLVRKQLREDSKYKKDLLYRGFNGKYIEKLLLTGQDTNGKYLFCYTEAEILEGTSEGDSDNSGPFEYVTDYKLGAIAVFDSKHLKNYTSYAYEFKNPNKKLEALVAVYILDYSKGYDNSSYINRD